MHLGRNISISGGLQIFHRQIHNKKGKGQKNISEIYAYKHSSGIAHQTGFRGTV